MHTLIINPEFLFQTLSDSTRLRIVRLLAMTKQEVCLCELVDSLFEPQYKLSKHLKILRQNGLISIQKEGRWVYHRLVTEPHYLVTLYQVICLLPDNKGVYQQDITHFEKRLTLRENGRCKIGIQSYQLKTKGT